MRFHPEECRERFFWYLKETYSHVTSAGGRLRRNNKRSRNFLRVQRAHRQSSEVSASDISWRRCHISHFSARFAAREAPRHAVGTAREETFRWRSNLWNAPKTSKDVYQTSRFSAMRRGQGACKFSTAVCILRVLDSAQLSRWTSRTRFRGRDGGQCTTPAAPREGRAGRGRGTKGRKGIGAAERGTWEGERNKEKRRRRWSGGFISHPVYAAEGIASSSWLAYVRYTVKNGKWYRQRSGINLKDILRGS